MNDIIGAGFGILLSFALAAGHLAAFRNPQASPATRILDRWYSRWWRTPEDRRGILGFMAAACLFMTAVMIVAFIYEVFST